MENNRNGDTKGLEEVEELFKSDLSKDSIDNVETKSKVKDDKHTTPVRYEEAHNMTAVEHLFNVSDPTKEFGCFKYLLHYKDLSDVASQALGACMQIEIKDREKGTTYTKAS